MISAGCDALPRGRASLRRTVTPGFNAVDDRYDEEKHQDGKNYIHLDRSDRWGRYTHRAAKIKQSPANTNVDPRPVKTQMTSSSKPSMPKRDAKNLVSLGCVLRLLRLIDSSCVGSCRRPSGKRCNERRGEQSSHYYANQADPPCSSYRKTDIGTAFSLERNGRFSYTI